MGGLISRTSNQKKNTITNKDILKKKKEVQPNIFSIQLNTKINHITFCESSKLKKQINMKYRKRILISTISDHIHIFSTYFGNMIFLIFSIKLNSNYELKHLDFLTKENSSHIVLILIERITLLKTMLILEIKKSEESKTIILNGLESMDDKNKSDYEDSESNSDQEESENLSHDRTDPEITSKEIAENVLNSSDEEEIENNNPQLTIMTNNTQSFHERARAPYNTQFYSIVDPKTNPDLQGNQFSFVKFGSYTDIQRIIIQNTSFMHSADEFLVDNYNILIKSYSKRTISFLRINSIYDTYILLYEVKMGNLEDLIIYPSIYQSMIIFDCKKSYFHYCSSEKVFQTEIIINSIQNKNIVNLSEIYRIAKFQRNENFSKNFNESVMSENTSNSNYIETFAIFGFCNSRINRTTERKGYIALLKLTLKNSEMKSYQSKIRLICDEIDITDISFGPFSNGPILASLKNSNILIFSMTDLSLINVIQIDKISSIDSILNEKYGFCIFAMKNEGFIAASHIVNKNSDYYFYEDKKGKVTRIKKMYS